MQYRPRVSEGRLVGTAMLAGIGIGLFDGPADAVSRFVRRDHVFKPGQRRHAVYRKNSNFTRNCSPPPGVS